MQGHLFFRKMLSSLAAKHMMSNPERKTYCRRARPFRLSVDQRHQSGWQANQHFKEIARWGEMEREPVRLSAMKRHDVA